MSNNHFIWDSYSDQPQVIKDRAFKKATRRKELKDNLKLLSYLFVNSIKKNKTFISKYMLTYTIMSGNQLNIDYFSFPIIVTISSWML